MNTPLPFVSFPDLTNDSLNTPHISQTTMLSSLSKVQIEQLQTTGFLAASFVNGNFCEETVRQQSNDGLNIGMICAKNKLINATLKALDDNIASAQQSSSGETIGMICARIIAGDITMAPAFEKAASNTRTILIKDHQGRNIIDIARASSYAGATLANKFERTLLEAQLLQPELDK